MNHEPAAVTLAAFCADIQWARLPAAVQQRTRELLLDHLGVAIRGSSAASTQPVLQFVRAQQGQGPATVIGAAFTTAPSWAALANGTAAHVTEMDDVTSESSLHPGVAIIPAALAVAEAQGKDATALLGAIVAGYEITLRAGNALNPASAYARGFHPTPVAGVFGAAVAAGRLLGLDDHALTRALGIAGTLASGSLEFLSDGSWTKRLNAGWAAHAGIVTAGLAQTGFNGPATVFDGPLGLLRSYTDEPRGHRLLEGLGDGYEIMRVAIKPYGCCRYNHGLIDGVLALREQHGLRPQDVTAIRLGVLRAGDRLVASPIEQKRAPQNVVDAQFSAPFAAAVALVRGAADVNQYTLANVHDPTIQSLMAVTDCFHDPALDAVYPKQWPARVEIVLQDGRILSQHIAYPTGEPENPVARDDLVAKFVMLAGSMVSERTAADLADRILALGHDADVGALLATLRGKI